MGDSLIIQTPLDFAEGVKVGRRRFWKQILPIRTINYDGRKINFDKQYVTDLAQSFRKEAFDQVPIVFADSNNSHNMDPRNYGGQVLDMQARPDGLYGLVEADEEAAKAIEKNPRLGVSARIREGVSKVDGRVFNRAIEHVLLTMNPRMTGMSPWQAVELSEDAADIEVVDLTAETYEEETPMGKTTSVKSRTSRKIDLSNLSDEQFETLLDLAGAAMVEDDEDLEDLEDLDDEDGDEDEGGEPTEKVRRKKSRTKVTIEKDSEDNGDEDGEDGDETSLPADLSDRLSKFEKTRIDMAEERWTRDRAVYVTAGVPPFLLDLAEPVLRLPDAVTIDLSDGEKPLDASDTIRKMLDGVKGVVDLSGEIGTDIDLSDALKKDDDDAAFLDAWSKQYG